MTGLSEQWRGVPGFEGSYEVSSLGRVRSLGRTTVRSNGRSYVVAARFLRATAPPKGYPMVNLYHVGARHSVKVHRLVALAFLGEPEPGQEVLHGDGNPLNNHVENLRWGTHSENLLDASEHGRLGLANASKTHCKRNHEFTAENTRTRSGRRHCRSCDALRVRLAGS